MSLTSNIFGGRHFPLPAKAEEPKIEYAPIPIAPTSNGRVSGKSWKGEKTATVRTYLQDGVKSKSWTDRMEKTKKEQAIKQLQAELQAEKQAEFTRKREITLERKKAAEERRRFEEEKAKAETMTSALPINADLDHRWANAKRQDYGAKQAGAKRSTGVII
ncbi:hypothetical protein FIBSPDRAFT_1051261 [Athelia psychrophila]|uniref:rRNA-processing protein n=1 Tax=Athelia psychrophila TaxID=1759441 RepID=A0A165ZFG2_9AGAM|nr:hypothetical protein FIBSPDRAFT_1051261 [Fibularhizoctonia sp. CBS 109695]